MVHRCTNGTVQAVRDPPVLSVGSDSAVEVQQTVWNLQRFSVTLVLAGAQILAGTSCRLYYLNAVGSVMQRTQAESALIVTAQELKRAAVLARLTQVDLDRVQLDRGCDVTRGCEHIKAVNARVAADPSVLRDGERHTMLAACAGELSEVHYQDQLELESPLEMSQVLKRMVAASDAQDSRKARRKASYRRRRAAWRKASSRGKGETIGRYSEKEKKTFLKKGSNNLLNEFHEGRN
jgi:hypothetical protein